MQHSLAVDLVAPKTSGQQRKRELGEGIVIIVQKEADVESGITVQSRGLVEAYTPALLIA